MSPRRLRLASPVLLATAGLAFAGCGGSGGDEASYVKTYEGACKSIKTATTDFATSTAKLQGQLATNPNAAVKTFRDGFSGVLDTFGKQMDVMADADAPKKWKDFQESVSDSADDTKKGLDQAKEALGKVKSVQDISKLGSTFQNLSIGKGMDEIPKDLAKKAPSCGGFGGGSSTAS